MVELGQELRFAFEALEAFVVLDEGGGQNFDRDIAFELGVPGAVDLAHPAFAQLGGDLVRAEPGSDHFDPIIVGRSRSTHPLAPLIGRPSGSASTRR